VWGKGRVSGPGERGCIFLTWNPKTRVKKNKKSKATGTQLGQRAERLFGKRERVKSVPGYRGSEGRGGEFIKAQSPGCAGVKKRGKKKYKKHKKRRSIEEIRNDQRQPGGG